MTKEEQDQTIEENLWLVEFVARKYKDRADWSDMVSAGRFGLVRGITKYDPDKSKASTYLIHWVRAEILKCLYEDRNVHVPWNRINKYIKQKGDANFADGIYPRYEISLDTRAQASSADWDGDGNSDGVEFQSSLSSEFINRMADDETSEHVLHLLENSKLSEKEKEVIVPRFGLHGEESKTLKQIGQLLGYTAMGIQKIEKKGIAKLSKNKLLVHSR